MRYTVLFITAEGQPNIEPKDFDVLSEAEEYAEETAKRVVGEYMIRINPKETV